jgi:glucosamine-6-phosphate deaminase
MAPDQPRRATGPTGIVRCVLVPPTVFAHPDDLGDAVAALVVERYRARQPGRRFLLGCPGGRSLRTSYARLARRAAEQQLDLRDLVVVMMDEYVELGPAGRPVAVDPARPWSCRRFGAVEIVGGLNAAVPARHAVPAEHLWLPDPAEPEAYEERLAAAGGIDVFLLASGASDGHVAFNPPGADRESRTRVVPLPESTRRDNLATFPSFGGDIAAVPSHGVTVGIATIRERSAEAVMVVPGADKWLAAARLAGAAEYRPDWPATVLAECRSPQLFLDRAAMRADLASAASPG